MLQRVLHFEYIAQGVKHAFDMPIQDGWVPVGYIVDALGIKRSRVVPTLQTYPHEFLTLPGSRGQAALCLRSESIAHWLQSLTRYRDQARLKHFQTVFILTLNELLEERSEGSETEAVLPEPDCHPEYLTTQDAVRNLRDHGIIYADGRPLDHADRMRVFLNQMGITDYDTLKHAAVVMEAAILHRLSAEGGDQPYETLKLRVGDVHPTTYDAIRRQGWDVAPIFFLKYPHLYTREYYVRVQAKAGTHEPEVVKAARWAATWFEQTFAAKVAERLEIHQEIQVREQQKKDEERRNEIARTLQEGRLPEWLLEFLAPETDEDDTRTDYPNMAADAAA